MTPRAKRSESAVYMLAGELMSSPAIAAFATETVSSVARLMLETGVGAVPVLNAARVPIGVVSDGDLLGRRKEDRRAWWLEVLANGGLPESTVTHEFALEDLREAVAVAIDKTNSHAVKVVFRP